MNAPASHFMPPNSLPIGAPNPVMPTAPNQPMLPGQNGHMAAGNQPQGVAFVQGQQAPQPGVQQFSNNRPDLSRPEILEQIVNQQNAAADPQLMAEQANAQRLEQILLETNQRANQQSEQLNQAVSLMSQTAQQQAEYQRQQLELQQSQHQAQLAAQQAAQLRPWEDPSLQLSADVQQTFEESLPVMEQVSRRNALQTAHETVGQIVTPEIQRLQNQIAALETRVQSNTQMQSQTFADQLLDIAGEHGLNLEVLEGQPDWIAYKSEISNPYTNSSIGNDVSAALQSGQTKDLRVLKQIFKSFAEKRNNELQGAGNELPPQVGGARNQPPQQQQQPDQQGSPLDAVNQQAQELESYRGQLLDDLRRQRIDPAYFHAEIAKVEQGMDALISQAQT